MCSNVETADRAHARYTAARGELLQAIADLAQEEQWRHAGKAALATHIAGRWSLAASTARELVRDADALRHRPALGAALTRAAISVDECRNLTVLCRPDTDDDVVWLETLPMWTFSDLEHEARKAKARERERHDGGVYLRMAPTPGDKHVKGTFQVLHDHAAILVAALDAQIPDGTPLRDWDHATGLALVQIAKHALDGAGSATHRTTVMLSVDEATLAGKPAADAVARLGTGEYVGADTARRLACDARVQTIIKNADGRVTGIGRTSRTIPPWLRRAVEDRDEGTCTFLDCDRTHYLECHHVEQWAQGGPTDLHNLLLTCWTHHEYLHEGGWSVVGELGPHVTWLQPDGSPYKPRVRVTLDTC